MGGGVAGWTAGIFAVRDRGRALLLEKLPAERPAPDRERIRRG